jgi:hypothetical protein
MFLFSDGITDQIGGNKVKKLKKKLFYEQILELQNKSINLQKSAIFNWFDSWKEENEQTDDIMIIGVEL